MNAKFKSYIVFQIKSKVYKKGIKSPENCNIVYLIDLTVSLAAAYL